MFNVYAIFFFCFLDSTSPQLADVDLHYQKAKKVYANDFRSWFKKIAELLRFRIALLLWLTILWTRISSQTVFWTYKLMNLYIPDPSTNYIMQQHNYESLIRCKVSRACDCCGQYHHLKLELLPVIAGMFSARASLKGLPQRCRASRL